MPASARELLVPFFTPLVWCGRGIRTHQLRKPTLYQLSYRGGVEVHLLFYRLNLPVDFILTVLPLQLFMSVLSDFSTQCLLTLVILAAVLVYLCSTQRPHGEALRAADVFNIPMGKLYLNFS